MSDITKCNNKSCPEKETCWRWLAPVNEKWQSYSLFEWDNGCEFYWEIKRGQRVNINPVDDYWKMDSISSLEDELQNLREELQDFFNPKEPHLKFPYEHFIWYRVMNRTKEINERIKEIEEELK